MDGLDRYLGDKINSDGKLGDEWGSRRLEETQGLITCIEPFTEIGNIAMGWIVKKCEFSLISLSDISSYIK